VFKTDANGALVDISAKSSAYLSVEQACIHRIKHVEEAGIVPGMVEEFVIIGENESDDSLLLSLRNIQYELAWERCRQLQAEDVIVKAKVCLKLVCYYCGFCGYSFRNLIVMCRLLVLTKVDWLLLWKVFVDLCPFRRYHRLVVASEL